jgi:hypothetical protein
MAAVTSRHPSASCSICACEPLLLASSRRACMPAMQALGPRRTRGRARRLVLRQLDEAASAAPSEEPRGRVGTARGSVALPRADQQEAWSYETAQACSAEAGASAGAPGSSAAWLPGPGFARKIGRSCA